MKIHSLKRITIPKVAVLVTGMVIAFAVAAIAPNPAQANPGRAANCAGCHSAGGSVAATPSTATPAANANYTVQLSPAPDGYWITGSGVSLAGGAASSVTVKAPAAAGTYVYTVYVRNGNAAQTTYTITVPSVTPPTTTTPPTTPPVTTTAPAGAPAASFTATFPAGVAPVVVGLTGSATNNPTSWAWNFGNGTTSSAQNPWVSYATAGTYTVTLTASNASGASAPVTKTITVTATAPPTTTPPATSAAVIQSLSSSDGERGDRITIRGSGFGQAGVVKFGTVTASVSSWSTTRISVTVPRQGSSDAVPVTVTPTNGTASNALTFEYGESDD